jgi:hypothetical protein
MSLSNYDWETMAGILVGILTAKPLIFYYINVKLPNLDLELGISYLEREGEQRERDREKERYTETEKERVRHKERERERELIIKISGNAVLPN